MAMIHDVRSRQLTSIGNNDGGFYAPPSSVPPATSAPHYGYYRQHSPPLTATQPSQYNYVNREMEFFGNNNDYRMYPPSPPGQQAPIANVAPISSAPYHQYQAPAYVRSAPQEMFQPMEALPRMSMPGTAPAPMPHHFTTRLPSPFNHHEGVHPATQRRSSTTLPGLRKTGKRSHSCMVCGKVFARPSALQTHLYSHTGEKPFKCEHVGCGRSFSVVSNLRRHARVHKD